jgi:hypothetical protein
VSSGTPVVVVDVRESDEQAVRPPTAPHPNFHLCVAAELSLLHFQSISAEKMEVQVG